MEDVLIGSAGGACMDSVDEVKPHPNTGRRSHSRTGRRGTTMYG